MEAEINDLCLILNGDGIIVNSNFRDQSLFLAVKEGVLERLVDPEISIISFNYAPDNTADGHDELLHDGILLRIIVSENSIGISRGASIAAIKKAFYSLVKNASPYCASVLLEEGKFKKEKTIELIY